MYRQRMSQNGTPFVNPDMDDPVKGRAKQAPPLHRWSHKTGLHPTWQAGHSGPHIAASNAHGAPHLRKSPNPFDLRLTQAALYFNHNKFPAND